MSESDTEIEHIIKSASGIDSPYYQPARERSSFKETQHHIGDEHWIFNIRHGERADYKPDLNIQYPISFDPPLTPDGKQMAFTTG